MSDILVDSSVWIDFFRGDKPSITRLDPLLLNDRVAVSGPIIAEVTSGALTLASFTLVKARLGSTVSLSDPKDLWDRVADARFALARQGVQANLVDLMIAVTAHVHNHKLLTRDKDFSAIVRVIPLDLETY